MEQFTVLLRTSQRDIGTVPLSVTSSDVSDHPDVWTDGSFVLDELSGVGVGGCGVYSLRSGAGWFGRR